MANVIEILIQAKNQASAEIDKATGGLGKFATAAGIGAAAGNMAGQAIVAAMQQAKSTIIDMTLAQSDNVEMLDRMANYTGISVQKLDIMRTQLEADGLSADQLSQALRFLREQLNSGSDKLAHFGITSRDAFTALQQMSAAMSNAKDVGERAEIATAALGMRNAELAASVALSASNMSTLQADALRNGTALTGEYLAKMRELDATMDQFAKTQKSFSMAMAEMFQPALKGAGDLLNKLNSIGAEMKRMDSQINKIPGLRSGPTMMSAHDGFNYGNTNFAPPLRAGGGDAVVNPLVAKLDELVKAFTQLGSGGSLATLRGAMSGGGGSLNASDKAVEPITKSFTAIQEAAQQFGSNFQSSLSGMLSRALSITTTSNNLIVMAFASLANAVTQTIAEMMARAAAMGLVKLALNFVGGGGGVDAKIGKVFGAKMGASPLSAGGGNTFVIQSINSRDAMESIMNPTGSFRRANDRMRDINAAAMG